MTKNILHTFHKSTDTLFEKQPWLLVLYATQFINQPQGYEITCHLIWVFFSPSNHLHFQFCVHMRDMELRHYLISAWQMNTPLMMKYNVRHIKVPLEKPGFLPPQLQRVTDEGLLSTHRKVQMRKNINMEMQPEGTNFCSVVKCLIDLSELLY